MRFAVEPAARAAALVAVLLAVGCGSTVEVRGNNGPELEGLDRHQVGVDQPEVGVGTAPAPSHEPLAGGPTTPGPRAGGEGGLRPRGGRVGPQQAALIPGRHPGVTDTKVKAGFLYLSNAGTTLGAFGIDYAQGDELGEFRALVADQNRRGGVAGRRIEVVPRDLGELSDSARQAACTYFTQDDPVFMVFSSLTHSDGLNTCLAKGGVGYTSDWVAPPDRLLRGLKSMYAPDDLSAERYAALLGHSLVDGGFFTPGAKVATYHADTPDYERIDDRVLKPILAAAGIEVVYEYAYDPSDTTEVGQTSTVVFQMQAAGVTHVISYESPLFLMTAAESQNWHPYWAVTSRHGAAFLEASAPPEQVKKAMGPGWQPTLDIASSRLKGYMNSEEKRCLETLAKAGYSYQGTPRFIGQMLCGELYHFVHVLTVARELSTEGFRLAAESLPPYLSPVTFRLSFTGGRHDGAAAYRMVAWQASCSCFAYTGPIRPAP